MFQHIKQSGVFRFIAIVIVAALLAGIPIQSGYAQVTAVLPPPGSLVRVTGQFNPAQLIGLKINAKDPFHVDFVMDKGDARLSDDGKKEEYTKLIRHFLTALTVANKDIWVNLSPYESTRVTSEDLGRTEVGKELLEQDYVLKQLAASLMYPEDASGQQFWKRIYEEAAARFGTTEIPVDTFNKVWIRADRADIYQKDNVVFLVKSHLKVMLEKDLLAETRGREVAGGTVTASSQAPTAAQDLAARVIREIIIPMIEKEVNEGSRFAVLRQVYNGMILATWYKKTLHDSLLSRVYVDQNKLGGVEVDDPAAKEKIYGQYLEAFKTGVFNYIKEEQSPVDGGAVPRKYFSGGTTPFDAAAFVPATAFDAARLFNGDRAQELASVDFASAVPGVLNSLMAGAGKTYQALLKAQEELARRFDEELVQLTVQAETRGVENPGAYDGITYGSGMAGISEIINLALDSALGQGITPNDGNIVVFRPAYGCTDNLNTAIDKKYKGIVRFVSSLKELETAVDDKTLMVYFESPVNPTLEVVSLKDLVAISRKRGPGALITLDNTFATSFGHFTTLGSGIDIVNVGITKGQSGRGDVMGTIIVANKALVARFRESRDVRGKPMAFEDVRKALQTLPSLFARLRKHERNIRKYTAFLQEQKSFVNSVTWPGSKDHPQSNVVEEQMMNPSSIFSIRFNSEAAAKAFLRLARYGRVFELAVSLGQVHNLVEFPKGGTHRTLSPEELAHGDIQAVDVRWAAGIEDPEDTLRELQMIFAVLELYKDKLDAIPFDTFDRIFMVPFIQGHEAPQYLLRYLPRYDQEHRMFDVDTLEKIDAEPDPTTQRAARIIYDKTLVTGYNPRNLFLYASKIWGVLSGNHRSVTMSGSPSTTNRAASVEELQGHFESLLDWTGWIPRGVLAIYRRIGSPMTVTLELYGAVLTAGVKAAFSGSYFGVSAPSFEEAIKLLFKNVLLNRPSRATGNAIRIVGVTDQGSALDKIISFNQRHHEGALRNPSGRPDLLFETVTPGGIDELLGKIDHDVDVIVLDYPSVISADDIARIKEKMGSGLHKRVVWVSRDFPSDGETPLQKGADMVLADLVIDEQSVAGLLVAPRKDMKNLALARKDITTPPSDKTAEEYMLSLPLAPGFLLDENDFADDDFLENSETREPAPEAIERGGRIATVEPNPAEPDKPVVSGGDLSKEVALMPVVEPYNHQQAFQQYLYRLTHGSGLSEARQLEAAVTYLMTGFLENNHEARAAYDTVISGSGVTAGGDAIKYALTRNPEITKPNLVYVRSAYGGTMGNLTFWKKYGIDVRAVYTHHQNGTPKTTEELVQELSYSFNNDTVAFVFESPNNPAIQVEDIETFVEAAREHAPHALTIFDGAFGTPAEQQPLKWKVDLHIDVETKRLGPGYAYGSSITGKKEHIEQLRKIRSTPMHRKDIRALLEDGLPSFFERERRAVETTKVVFDWLVTQQILAVTNAMYPGHPSHPQYELAKKQMGESTGSLFHFEFLTPEAASLFIQLWAFLRTGKHAVSLGQGGTLWQIPSSGAGSSGLIAAKIEEVDLDLRQQGTSRKSVRAAIGLEAPEDIIRDLETAFTIVKMFEGREKEFLADRFFGLELQDFTSSGLDPRLLIQDVTGKSTDKGGEEAVEEINRLLKDEKAKREILHRFAGSTGVQWPHGIGPDREASLREGSEPTPDETYLVLRALFPLHTPYHREPLEQPSALNYLRRQLLYPVAGLEAGRYYYPVRLPESRDGDVQRVYDEVKNVRVPSSRGTQTRAYWDDVEGVFRLIISRTKLKDYRPATKLVHTEFRGLQETGGMSTVPGISPNAWVAHDPDVLYAGFHEADTRGTTFAEGGILSAPVYARIATGEARALEEVIAVVHATEEKANAREIQGVSVPSLSSALNILLETWGFLDQGTWQEKGGRPVKINVVATTGSDLERAARKFQRDYAPLFRVNGEVRVIFTISDGIPPDLDDADFVILDEYEKDYLKKGKFIRQVRSAMKLEARLAVLTQEGVRGKQPFRPLDYGADLVLVDIADRWSHTEAVVMVTPLEFVQGLLERRTLTSIPPRGIILANLLPALTTLAPRTLAERGADVGYGGIEFNENDLIFNIKTDGSGMPLPLEFQDPAMLHIQGLTPVIRSIVPLTPVNMPVLAELLPVATPPYSGLSLSRLRKPEDDGLIVLG